jgi:hypothetical protein
LFTRGFPLIKKNILAKKRGNKAQRKILVSNNLFISYLYIININMLQQLIFVFGMGQKSPHI